MSLLNELRKVFSLASRSTPQKGDGSPPADLPKWHAHLVLVCEKCGAKLEPEAKLSLGLKDQVKKKLVTGGQWGPVRVVTSSCLDLCPQGKIAVGFTGDSGRTSEVLPFEPETLVERVLHKIEERQQ
jgi:predicted metal-binding protein